MRWRLGWSNLNPNPKSNFRKIVVRMVCQGLFNSAITVVLSHACEPPLSDHA